MKLWKYIKAGVCDTWIVPGIAAMGSIVCVCLVAWISHMSMGLSVQQRGILGDLLCVVLALQSLLFFGLPLWLLLRTIIRLVLRLGEVWSAWLWSVLAGGVVLMSFFVSSFFTAIGDFDDSMQGITMPEELSPEKNPGLAIPIGFSFVCPSGGGSLHPVVEKWARLCGEDTESDTEAAESLPTSAPHLEALALRSPELLLEFKLRAMCHRALTPGSRVPHLSIFCHPDEVIHPESASSWYSRYDDMAGRQLGNQWKLSMGPDGRSNLKRMQLLDTMLAPLAANPTPAGLDALVPSLPDKPVIVLLEGFQPGIYRMLIVVPGDYPEGSFAIKAHEYTRGNPLSIDSEKSYTPTPYRKLCRIATEDKLMVHSGEWGEYYASIWELHFSPADGSPSRCVNSQLYLMQGWSR